jgi:hypothetical protein
LQKAYPKKTATLSVAKDASGKYLQQKALQKNGSGNFATDKGLFDGL